MKANIYVDGFNLYYGAVKGTPYRWLDIAALCRLLLPRDTINQIKYFTALVHPRPSDLDQPRRQQTYLRALRTIPNLTIVYGHFLTHEIMMPLAPPRLAMPKSSRPKRRVLMSISPHICWLMATMMITKPASSSQMIPICFCRFKW